MIEPIMGEAMDDDFADVPPDRSARGVARVLLVLLLLIVTGAGVWLLGFETGSGGSTLDDLATRGDAALVQPEAAPPLRPVADPNAGADGLASWAARVSVATGIPARAAQAYGQAEMVVRSRLPACHLSWNTLAGIGRVESNHGQFGGAQLREDGTESQPIIGVPLDGTPGVRDIPDTDHGVLDGDPVHDRAVGPMQFLPSTWRQYTDPGADPQNIDVAAVAAGRYLCAQGRDLATGPGWWSAVLSYNAPTEYGWSVFRSAESYAAASQPTTRP
jgi:membrane-bound lytic murein transglycosylase B